MNCLDNRPDIPRLSGQFYSGLMVMKGFPVLIVLFLFGITLTAQQTDPRQQEVERAYESFRNKEFKAEFGELPTEDDGKSVMVMGYQKTVTLPGWMSAELETGTGICVAFAVSDPYLDSALAYKQALYRALALAALSRGCHIQNISDNYYLDRAGHKTLGKFSSFTSIGSEMTYDAAMLDIRYVEYTGNDEAIIMVGVPEEATRQNDAESIGCSIEIFQSESGKTERSSLVTKLIFEFIHTNHSGEKETASWQLNESSDGIEIVSVWNGEILELPAMKFRYTLGGAEEINTDGPGSFPFDLKYGFWYGYIFSLGAQLEQLDVFNSQVKYLDDNFYHQYQDLTRVISSNAISFGLKRINISGNKISLHIIKN